NTSEILACFRRKILSFLGEGAGERDFGDARAEIVMDVLCDPQALLVENLLAFQPRHFAAHVMPGKITISSNRKAKRNCGGNTPKPGRFPEGRRYEECQNGISAGRIAKNICWHHVEPIAAFGKPCIAGPFYVIVADAVHFVPL